MISILAFVNGNSGPSFHRLTMPLLLMEDVNVFITNDLQEKHFEDKQPGIFVYNRILPDHALPIVKELKLKYGFKIVVDIDDYWELDQHHILNTHYQEIDFARKQIEQIQAADMVTVTHERLLYEVLPYNENVHVCQNAIPHQGQFDIERIKSPFTRLFWQGSDTHKADVEILARPIHALSHDAGKIKMVMAGYAPEHDDWHSMVMNYTAGAKHQYKLIPYTKVTDYYKAYAEADICLVPLVNSKFNRMKSNLKILEAANLKLPVIASAVHPYLDLPLLYCSSSADWVKHIRKLIRSRGAQREAGEKLFEYCSEFYNFKNINEKRKQILEYVGAADTTRV